MRISTRGRYGTRMLLDLALNYGNGPTLLKNIAKRQEISMKYLSQLIIPLKVAGLVTGTKGAHGGYYLAKSPEKINLSDIVNALEGSLNPAGCVDNPDICDRSDKCATYEVWKKIGDKCLEMLESISLKDLMAIHYKKNKAK